MLTDQEIIDRVWGRWHSIDESVSTYPSFYRVLVRYTRWLERAEHKAEIDALEQRYTDSENILNREAAWEVKGLQDEISHWKYKCYELGGNV